ncbi:DNRLRE domain-containing protein [Planctomycetales bacterium ZRK34]|nr:DNRLRE domain-containing protein [Planctomycetales bacterium ZRK34]
MSMKARRWTQRFTAAMGVVMCVGAVQASTLYQTDFPEAEGSLPTGWVGIVDEAGWAIDAAGDLRYGGSTNASLALGDGFVLGDSSTADSLTNVVVSADIRKSNAGITGLITHHPSGSGTSETFYHARLSGTTSLQLYRFNGGVSAMTDDFTGNNTVTISESYTLGETWRLVMTTLGGKDAQQVGALLFNDAGQLVGKIRSTSTTSVLTSGSAGVRGASPSVYESFSIATPTQITTADGNGADAFIEFRTDQAGAADTNHGTDTTVQTKSGEDSNQLYRKSYLRYDLSSVGDDQVFSASLDLTVNNRVTTGQTFNVYALVDGVDGDDDPSGAGWIESGAGGITWNNAPGNDTGTGLDSDAVLLGTFTGGVNDETLRFTSEALVDFLNADTNGLVTFILVDLTPGSFGDSNFLQFDSKEQSGGVAPALSLVLIPEPTSLMVMIGMLLGVIRRRPAMAVVTKTQGESK